MKIIYYLGHMEYEIAIPLELWNAKNTLKQRHLVFVNKNTDFSILQQPIDLNSK